MNADIDTLNNFSNWQRLYNCLPAEIRSAFFCPSYYQSYKEVEQAEVECYWAEQDGQNYLF